MTYCHILSQIQKQKQKQMQIQMQKQKQRQKQSESEKESRVLAHPYILIILKIVFRQSLIPL